MLQTAGNVLQTARGTCCRRPGVQRREGQTAGGGVLQTAGGRAADSQGDVLQWDGSDGMGSRKRERERVGQPPSRVLQPVRGRAERAGQSVACGRSCTGRVGLASRVTRAGSVHNLAITGTMRGPGSQERERVRAG